MDLAFRALLQRRRAWSVGQRLFARVIDNLNPRNLFTSLQAVNWSPAQRWVFDPYRTSATRHPAAASNSKRNSGLDELIAWDAPKVNLRANYSRYWSNVEDVPGAGQPAGSVSHGQTANIGV